MTYSALIRANFMRNPVRSLLTGACVATAFLLFGLLQPINKLFTEGADAGTAGRLIVIPRHSVSDLLPIHYLDQLKQMDGVSEAVHLTWFGGTYLDPANFFAQYAVAPAEFFSVFNEIELPNEQRQAFVSTRRGAIVGRETAAKHGWQVGEQIPLIPNIWHNQDAQPWVFELVGIYNSLDTSVIDNKGFYFGYDYFDSYRAFGNGTVGSFAVRLDDSKRTAEIAQTIDARFANSEAETKTLPDRAYALSFVKQIGEIGLMVTAILAAVFFTILLLTGHSVAQGLRERTVELAVMKVLGFQRSNILWMILLESALQIVTAALIGLLVAQLLLFQLDELIPQMSILGSLKISGEVLGAALALAIGLSLVVGLPPALRATRLGIVDALRV